MDMEKYYSQLKQTTVEGFKRLNNTTEVENKKWDVTAGSWDVTVVRGKVLEKASASRVRFNTRNPETGEDTRFDIFQIKAYPANPKTPIILFNMENRAAKEDKFGGFLDVVPVAASKEDLNFLNTEIRRITEKHVQNYEALRKKLEGIYKMDHWEKPLSAGIGIRLELAAEQLDLVKEAGLKWVESYFRIVAQREREPYNDAEKSLMDSVRTGILEFYMLKDMSFRVVHQHLGVPLEALSLAHFAPIIKY